MAFPSPTASTPHEVKASGAVVESDALTVAPGVGLVCGVPWFVGVPVAVAVIDDCEVAAGAVCDPVAPAITGVQGFRRVHEEPSPLNMPVNVLPLRCILSQTTPDAFAVPVRQD